jgi:hypothetical protein
MYMSAIDHHTEAERQDSISDRFCCGDIEEEEEDGAGEPQWTWVSAGACFLDAERLPPSWFVQTNNRAEPEVLCILSTVVIILMFVSVFRIRNDLPLPNPNPLLAIRIRIRTTQNWQKLTLFYPDFNT